MEILEALLFALLLIGGLIYLLAKLLTPIGLILTIAVVVFIWYRVARQRKHMRKRRREEEEMEAKAKADQELRTARARNSRELKEDETEFGDLAARFSELLSATGERADGVGRASYIIKGREIPEISARDAVFVDVSQMLAAIAEAHGSIPKRLVGLGHAIYHKVGRDRCADWREAESTIEHLRSQHNAVSLPFFVRILANCDISEGTSWGSEAAKLYRDLVLRGCGLCQSSTGLRMLADEYIKLLKPYIPSKDYASGSPPSTRACEVCRQSYGRLGIPTDATRDAIKQRYRDLCNVWHPTDSNTMKG